MVLNLASVLEKLKRYEEAERHIASLHERQPDDPTTCNFYGYLLALMGKDLDNAEELVRKALEGEPQNGYYTDSLGWVFFMRGDYPRAIEELEKAAADCRERSGHSRASRATRTAPSAGTATRSTRTRNRKTFRRRTSRSRRKIDATKKKAAWK